MQKRKWKRDQDILLSTAARYYHDVFLELSFGICPSPGKAKQKARMLFPARWPMAIDIKTKLGDPYLTLFLKPAIDNFFVPGDRQASLRGNWGYKNLFAGILQRPHRQLQKYQSKQPFEEFHFHRTPGRQQRHWRFDCEPIRIIVAP
mgnify:CR=1 FL=1